MRKFLHSPLFRFFICFLLIFSMFYSYVTIPARASAVVATYLTFEALMAIMASTALGIVAIDLTVETWNKIGKNLEDTVITEVDTSELQSWMNLKQYYEQIQPDPPEDPGEWKDKLEKLLSRGILGAIAAWICSTIAAGGFQTDGDTAPSGYVYYNGVLLPVIPDTGYSSSCIGSNNYNYVLLSAAEIKYASPSTNKCTIVTPSVVYLLSKETALSGGQWHEFGSGYTSYTLDNPFWSSVNIPDGYMSSTFWLEASAPSSSKDVIVTPEIYVGDIPEKIKDGELDKDNLEVPLLDPFPIIQNPSTAFQTLNGIQTGLKDGSLTLEDYLNQYQFQPNSGTGGDSGTDPNPDDSTDPSVPADIADYTFDLRNIFPFCIPFDLYDFFACLDAPPEAPVINWELYVPGGGAYPLIIDLSVFDEVAELLRRLELLLFCIGLAFKTRDLIKG